MPQLNVRLVISAPQFEHLSFAFIHSNGEVGDGWPWRHCRIDKTTPDQPFAPPSSFAVALYFVAAQDVRSAHEYEKARHPETIHEEPCDNQ
jgi:hypothetical protein